MIVSRWPVHPTPFAGECLSSWLRRVAMIYELSLKELVEEGLGFPRHHAGWLDLCPPNWLFQAIAKRTGLSVERLMRTTFVSVLPFLVAQIDTSIFGDNSVFCAPTNARQRGFSHLISWFRNYHKDGLQACRSCLRTYPNASIGLAWRLSIVQSCPIHGLILEPARIDDTTVYWTNELVVEKVPKPISSMDARTWAVLTSGFLELPGGKIDARTWFTLLRAIQDELTRPIPIFERSLFASERASIWARLDAYSQSGTVFWKLSPTRFRSALIAVAIDMMERGQMPAEGAHAKLFYPRQSERERFRSGAFAGVRK